MNAHHVYTLSDFKGFIAARQASFDRLTAIGKEAHKLETALKHLNNYEKLLPIHAQSKKGFARTKERFAEEHKEELAAFGKACRYMSAKALKPGDKKRLLAEQKKLTEERETIPAALMTEDIGPSCYYNICPMFVADAMTPVMKDGAISSKNLAKSGLLRPFPTQSTCPRPRYIPSLTR